MKKSDSLRLSASSLQDFVGELAKLPVLVLAGGLGTRLRSVFKGPKAMAPISGIPFLSYLLRSLCAAGLRRIILCVGYRQEEIVSWAGDGSAMGLSIEYSVEKRPLGTAGALRLAADQYLTRGPFAVVNGDTLLRVDYAALLATHLHHHGAGTLTLVPVADSGRYGAVEIDGQKRVTAFAEKSAERHVGHINAGVSLFDFSILNLIARDTVVSLEHQVIPQLISEGRLFAFPTEGYFIDIGVPDDYARAQRELKDLLP